MKYGKYLILALLAWMMAATCQARPEFRKLGPNIADKGSAFYDFRHFDLDSADKARHYRVWVGVPRKAAPQGGYPVLYALDGNSVMDRLDDATLGRISQGGQAPVLVAIGYQTELPFDVQARAIDYTPPPLHGSGEGTPIFRGRPGGGSHAFRSLLLEKIVPQAEKGLAVNPARRALWGHSFGGLFVVDTLLNTPEAFARYYPASPSIGQDFNQFLPSSEVLASRLVQPRTVMFFLDTGVRVRPQPQAPAAGNPGNTPARAGGPGQERSSNVDARPAFIAPLQSLDRLEVVVRRYPNLTHGSMFPIALTDALADLSGQSMSDPAQVKPVNEGP